MPLVALTLRPGINKQITPTLNEGGFSDGSRVRFPYGVPESIGGWQKAYAGQFSGACRGLHAWSTLANARTLGLGTSSNLYVGQGGKLFDVTPAGLPAGTVDTIGGTGWGTGSYGTGTWGTSRSGSSYGFFPTIWSIDNWGEEMLAAPRNGAIYRWRPVDGTGTAATAIPGDGPTGCKVFLVGMPERHAIALGAESGGTIDPMLVRFSDVEDYTVWTASATNSAGSFRLQDGSEIIGAVHAPLLTLIWTDAALIGMRFIGYPDVYGFTTLGTGCGLIAPNAATMLNGTAFWWSQRSFMMFNGSPQILPCDVYDEVFANVNQAQIGKVWCGVNAQFGEVTWHYPSADSMENDRYATFSTNPRLAEGQRWTIGALDRTAWIDCGVFPNPIATSPDGYIYYHEIGDNADGSPLNSFAETGFIDIADGDSMIMLNQIIPDTEGTQIGMTVTAQNYPGAARRSKGPFSVVPSTRYLSPRLRGRQIALRFDCGSINGFWRGGKHRIRLNQDGSR